MTPLWPSQKAFGEHGVPAGSKVVVRRRQLVARPGSGVLQLGPWADAKNHEVEGVGLDRTSSATTQGEQVGDSRTQYATIFCPWEADIEAGDKITFPDGVVVMVEGIPDRSRHLITGWRPPMSVSVQVTHG